MRLGRKQEGQLRRQAGTPGGKSGGGEGGGWQAQIWAADGSVGSVDVGEGQVCRAGRGVGVVRKLMPASRREMMAAWACLVPQEGGQQTASWLSGPWGLTGCGVG